MEDAGETFLLESPDRLYAHAVVNPIFVPKSTVDEISSENFPFSTTFATLVLLISTTTTSCLIWSQRLFWGGLFDRKVFFFFLSPRHLFFFCEHFFFIFSFHGKELWPREKVIDLNASCYDGWSEKGKKGKRLLLLRVEVKEKMTAVKREFFFPVRVSLRSSLANKSRPKTSHYVYTTRRNSVF